MKRKKVLGIALFASLLVLASFASSAFALTSQWLAGGNVITGEQGPLTTDSEGNIVLEEMNSGAKVTCKKTLDTGTVGPGPADTVSAVTFEECKGEGSCGTFESAEAVGLPWTTAVVLLEGSAHFWDLLANGGYKVTCKILGVKISSTCTKEDAFVQLEPNIPSSDVDALFNTEEEATCNTSGKATGLVHGEELILLTNGEALSVSEA